MHGALLLALAAVSSFAVAHPMRQSLLSSRCIVPRETKLMLLYLVGVPHTAGSRLTSNPKVLPKGTSDGFDTSKWRYHDIDEAEMVENANKAIILQRRALGI